MEKQEIFKLIQIMQKNYYYHLSILFLYLYYCLKVKSVLVPQLISELHLLNFIRLYLKDIILK